MVGGTVKTELRDIFHQDVPSDVIIALCKNNRQVSFHETVQFHEMTFFQVSQL